MLKIQIFILICATCFTASSCNQKNNDKSNINKGDTLLLKINFNPSFDERSETLLLKTDSAQVIQILIKNNFRAGIGEDTFWFKKIYLTNQQFLKLDSTLIKECKQRSINKKKLPVLDGMGISSLLVNKGDTNIRYFHSPSKNEDSIGYNFSKLLFQILKNTFRDSIITGYFNDLEGYIDESKWHRADPKRKIDQLRMKKYNWTISNQN